MALYFGKLISKNMVTTPENYLICTSVKIGRIGTQLYSAKDLRKALADIPSSISDHKMIAVNRSADELFSDATISSFNLKPVVINHPYVGLITLDNIEGVKVVGHITRVHRGEGTDSDFLMADIIFMDKNAITLIRRRNRPWREVSCGYHAEYRVETTTDGMTVDQFNIVGNHLALCKEGRAGHKVCITDSIDDMGTLDNDIPTQIDNPPKRSIPNMVDEQNMTPFSRAIHSVTRLFQRACTQDSVEDISGDFARDAANIIEALSSAAHPATTDSTTTATVDTVVETPIVSVTDSTQKEDDLAKVTEDKKPVTADEDMDVDEGTLDGKKKVAETTDCNTGEDITGTQDAAKKSDAKEDADADAKQDAGAAKQDDKDDAKMIQDALAPILDAIKELKASVAGLQKGATSDAVVTDAVVVDPAKAAFDSLMKDITDADENGDTDGDGDCSGGDGATGDSAKKLSAAVDDGASSLVVSPDQIGKGKAGKKTAPTSDSMEMLKKGIAIMAPMLAGYPDEDMRRATIDSLNTLLHPNQSSTTLKTIMTATQDSAARIHDEASALTAEVDHKAMREMYRQYSAEGRTNKETN